MTSAILVLSSIAAAQLLLVTNNNNVAYGQPSPQCEPGFTFNEGVCEQPATSFLDCPTISDRDLEYTLEENEEGTLVCNLYETITEPAKINEETGEPYCDGPFELIIREFPEGGDREIYCRYSFLSETVEPITVLDCPNGGEPNTETNTCQMRPGRGQSSPQCEPGFTFNEGVCEQPATSDRLTCPDDRDWTLEEGDGNLVCNLYTTETQPLQVDEETGEVFCNDPYELNPIEEPTECRYRYVTETTDPIPSYGCPNGGDLNTETLTCQMRPGQGE